MSGIVFGVDFAGIRQAGFFFHRKRVEFRTQHDGWSGAVLQDGDDPGAADVLSHLVAQAAQTVGQLRCGLRFVAGKFRILMQIKIQSMSLGIHGLDLS